MTAPTHLEISMGGQVVGIHSFGAERALVCPASVGARDWERLAIAARVDPERLLTAMRDMAARLPDAIAMARESMAPTAEESVAAGRLLGDLVPWIERCRTSVAG